jgi:molybdopterin-guanine dinucleotide biosynthesis protein
MAAMIYAWFAKKGAQLWAILAAIGAAIAIVFGFYEAAKRSGIHSEREKQANKEVERIDAEAVRKVQQAQEVAAVETNKVETANETAHSVNTLNDGDAANKLRDEWSRD